MIDWSGINLPFNVTQLLSAGMELFKVLGPFVLLGMAFVFVPHMIKAIRYAIQFDRKINSQQDFGTRLKDGVGSIGFYFKHRNSEGTKW